MLSDKEKEIVLKLCEGKPQKQIGGEVGITEAGVRWYVTNLCARFDVANSAALTAFCVSRGWVTIEKDSEQEAG